MTARDREGTLELKLVDDAGARFVEGSSERQLLHSVLDADLLVDRCLSGGVECVLLVCHQPDPLVL
jgi:hypothetical protein